MDQVLGWTATTLFTLMMIPQIVKTVKTRDLNGVSLALFVINFVANVVALGYATMIHQTPLQIKYIAALIVTSTYLVIYRRISRERS
jgi:uncharacterized protein with PQ loop repeat